MFSLKSKTKNILSQGKKNATIKLGTLALACLAFGSCKKDDVAPTPVSTSGADSLSMSTDARATTAFNITSILPKGYVTNGTVDYTSYIQSALSKYTNIVLPSFPVMVNDGGLTVRSNTTITFPSGSKVILKASSKSAYSIFSISRVSNVTLTNPVIVGDRNTHKGTSGEYGMGINIQGASNVTVTGANISNCWGDGIYIGGSNGVTSSNITISKASLTYNRRDGLSITSGSTVLVDGCYAAYSNGTSPYCGINIEPNSSTCKLQNITISNTKTQGNTGQGVQMSLKALYGGSGNNSNISLSFINNQDIGSRYGLKLSQPLTLKKGSQYVSGTIKVTNNYWQKSSIQPMTVGLADSHTSVAFSSPQVMNSSGSVLSDSQAKSLLTSKYCMLSGTKYTMTF